MLCSRLWKISPPSSLISWTATKTAVSSIYMNDTMIGNDIDIRMKDNKLCVSPVQ